MADTPILVDRAALMRQRQRIHPDSAFLQDEALSDIQDRLSLVKREFKSVAIVTGYPAFWSAAFPQAQVIPDDDRLDLEPGSHDLVIHAMALHWANDPVGQLIQCRRALKPDGLLIATCPGGQTLNELRSTLTEAEARIRGGLSPRVLPMGDIRDLGALLQRAGLALPVADTITLTAEYGDLPALFRDLRHMGEANALNARDRFLFRRDVMAETARLYATHFPGDAKPLRATFELVTLTGWAPAESQQKPLRPGSAQARLAQALGTDETPLQD